MSLSLKEWRQLHAIDKAVGRSDARLAALLMMFAQLAVDEAMPGHERLGSRRAWFALVPAIAAIVGMIMWMAAAACTVAQAGFRMAARPLRRMQSPRPVSAAGAAAPRAAQGRS